MPSAALPSFSSRRPSACPCQSPEAARGQVSCRGLLAPLLVGCAPENREASWAALGATGRGRGKGGGRRPPGTPPRLGRGALCPGRELQKGLGPGLKRPKDSTQPEGLAGVSD